MTEALSQWWSNPITAVLVSFSVAALAFLLMSGLFGVVRMGSIQFAGLLSARKNLLPGVPRNVEAFAGCVVFLVGAVAGLWVLLTGALWRVGTLTGAHGPAIWSVVGFVWLGLLALAAYATDGERGEFFAVMTLHLLRPAAPIVGVLARPQQNPQVAESDDENPEDDEVDEHEVRAFIGAGEEAGILEREEAELVASIVELSDTVAREIMTPRTDLVALPVDADFGVVQREFAESMFTRLPVYGKSLDNIEGVVHVKDVLRAVASGKTPSARELLRPVLVVPETKPLRDLLRLFQQSRQQLAVVVDEYGGTSGIVTLEDVLEEIVGEIQDEHQAQSAEIEREGDSCYIIAGNAHVETLAELFGLELEEDVAYDSVAGLVLDRLGHLPRPGETLEYGGLLFEVVEVERRRLKRVRVCPISREVSQ